MLLVSLLACFRNCPPVEETVLATLPERLSEAGLYADIATDTVAEGVFAYTPRFQLWSDGAEKRRWILLPEGATIDASDADAWRFPEGTRAWKEFTRDGVRVETRMIERVGPADTDWAAVAYLWDEDGGDATALQEGAVDALGTDHDVPTAEECVACHGGRESFVLGFSAVQLAGADGYDLDDLVAAGRVSPTPGVLGPGGDDEEALGYLHANCSHCHHGKREDEGGCYVPDAKLDLTLPSTLASADDAPVLTTGDSYLSPGRGKESELVNRMSGRSELFIPTTMPPLGTEVVDEETVQMLTAWIDGM